jgi:hypothetical protein
MPYARYRTECVGAGPEVSHITEKFKRMPLGLDRVGVRVFDPAHNVYPGRLYFVLLPPSGGFNQRSFALDSTAGSQFLYFTTVVFEIRWRYDLDCVET